MEETVKYKLANIFKGIGISIAFTMIMLLILSALLAYTNVSETWIQPIIIVITSVSILLGSSIGNLKINKNGILNGAIIGGIYFAIIYLISSIISTDFSINGRMIIIVVSGIICGIIGGIIGVNKK